MSDRKTKRLSGAQYRKRKAEKDEDKKKLAGSMEKYLNKNEDNEAQETTSGRLFAQEKLIIAMQKEEVCPETADEENRKYLAVVITEEENEDIKFTDAGLWPELLSNKMIEILVKNGPHQIEDMHFPENDYGKFSKSYYFRKLANGESIKREWLIYSKSKNAVHCFCCKIFSDTSFKLIKEGFCDWNHLAQTLRKHETSVSHIENLGKWVDLEKRLNSFKTVDKEEQRLLNMRKMYWFNVNKRIVFLIQYLAQQCLALRGKSNKLYERDNGNFLKGVEMLAKTDPVIAEHLKKIQTYKSINKKMPQYLGNKFQNQVIQLLADEIKNHIFKMLNQAKYYSIILDCTPDCSHTEQISVIIRFVTIIDNVVQVKEHFLGFHPIVNTTGEGLFDFVVKTLNDIGVVNILNMRGQGYDNGSNMRGKHIGLQRRILQINPRAFFVPCAAHTLILVVNDAAKVTLEVAEFFNLVQELYVFFSSSTHRWKVLKDYISNITLKSVSTTRWESRVNAVRPLRYQLGEIYDSLLHIIDSESDINTKTLANSLAKKIKTFKFVCSVIIWYDILVQIDKVSKMLQSKDMNLKTCTESLENLLTFIKSKRTEESFYNYIELANELAKEVDLDSDQCTFTNVQARIRHKKRQFHYETQDEPITDATINFRTNFYYVLLDQTIASLGERFELINHHKDLFLVIYEFTNFDDETIRKHCDDLYLKLTDQAQNSSDIDGIELKEELIFLKANYKRKVTPFELLEYIYKNGLAATYPNIAIVLRILLTMPVTVASAERSFSKLKIIKNYMRSTMTQERLSSIATIAIENEIGESLELDQLIMKMAEVKCRTSPA